MDTPQATAAPFGALRDAICQARETAREQLEAAWQLHVERVEEQLSAGWRDQIALVFEERFAELATGFEQAAERLLTEHLEAEREAAAARGRDEGRRDLCERLGEAARRVCQSQDKDQWSGALLEAAGAFCRRVALFSVEEGALRCHWATGLDDEAAAELRSARIPLEAAPAFVAALESPESRFVACEAVELAEPLARLLASPEGARVYVLPVPAKPEAAGVLCVGGEESQADLGALGVLAALAGSLWESRYAPRQTTAADLLAAFGRRPSAPLVEWASLPEREQELHLRAQRFARVQVAELRLYKSQAVKEGRASGNLYIRLRPHIDAGRETFRRQFLEKCPSMVDYFHVELVRTLANDNEALLGLEYPGALAC